MTQNESFSSYSSEDSDSSTEATTTEAYEIVPRENLQATLPCTFNHAQADLVENQNALRKKRGKNKDYELKIECQSLKKAIDYINQQDSVKWTRSDTRRTNEGEKRFYNCLKECFKRLYLLLTADTELTSVYVSNDQHQHSDEPNAFEKSLPKETRVKISRKSQKVNNKKTI